MKTFIFILALVIISQSIFALELFDMMRIQQQTSSPYEFFMAVEQAKVQEQMQRSLQYQQEQMNYQINRMLNPTPIDLEMQRQHTKPVNCYKLQTFGPNYTVVCY